MGVQSYFEVHILIPRLFGIRMRRPRESLRNYYYYYSGLATCNYIRIPAVHCGDPYGQRVRDHLGVQPLILVDLEKIVDWF